MFLRADQLFTIIDIMVAENHSAWSFALRDEQFTAQLAIRQDTDMGLIIDMISCVVGVARWPRLNIYQCWWRRTRHGDRAGSQTHSQQTRISISRERNSFRSAQPTDLGSIFIPIADQDVGSVLSSATKDFGMDRHQWYIGIGAIFGIIEPIGVKIHLGEKRV